MEKAQQMAKQKMYRREDRKKSKIKIEKRKKRVKRERTTIK